MNKQFIFPYKLNKNSNNINYYFNSGKSWLISFFIVSIFIIGYLSGSKIDNIDTVKYFITIVLYCGIYANYGYVTNIGMESIVIRNDVEKRKIYKNNLKDI